MKFRWTIKELKEKTDSEILRGILSERLGDLNPYSPLARRLRQIQDNLAKREEKGGRKS